MDYNSKNFFNCNSECYISTGYGYDFYDTCVLNFIKKHLDGNTSEKKLADIGGGSATFSIYARSEIDVLKVIVVDPSEKMLNSIDDDKIEKRIGMLPNSIPLNEKYDYIHVAFVLHHVVGSNEKESKILLNDSLKTINSLTKTNGYLILRERYLESYFMPGLIRKIIFDLCLIQNLFNVKIPYKEFLYGLQVFFYTRSELKTFLEQNGFEILDVVDIKTNSKLNKILLLKNTGSIIFMCKKSSRRQI